LLDGRHRPPPGAALSYTNKGRTSTTGAVSRIWMSVFFGCRVGFPVRPSSARVKPVQDIFIFFRVF
jgi:hypothetical protein